MSQLDKPTVLWVDLRNSDRSVTLFELFCGKFHIENMNPHNPVFDHHRLTPCAICFDFDYPDMHGLTLLRELREQLPQLPIIMMTEQHSESLMVWALRVRVWEILLKPMSRSAAEYQVNELFTSIASAMQDPAVLRDVSPMLRVPEESRYYGGSAETRAVHPALSYMQLHLGERVSEEQLASFCNLRPLQFSRLFRKAYNVTYQEMLQQLRIREATRLLENPEMQILDIALTVGYHDHSYFSRVFKKYLGVTPKTYQERLLGNAPEADPPAEQTKLYAVANLESNPESSAGLWARRRLG